MLMAFRYERTERNWRFRYAVCLASPASRATMSPTLSGPCESTAVRTGSALRFRLFDTSCFLAFVFRHVVRIRIEVESFGPGTVIDEIQSPRELGS
jgi:hypothetical protein